MRLADLLEMGATVNVTVSAEELRQAFVEWSRGDATEKQHTAEAVTRNSDLTKDVYTKRDAAQLLGVNLSTLWRWDKSGYLPATHVGRKVVYRKEDLVKILNK